MAGISFEGFDKYEDFISKVGELPDKVLSSMVNEGAKVLLRALKDAMPKFGVYAKKKAAKKSRFGGKYVTVTFEGTTAHNTPANTATFVYEHGRKARDSSEGKRAVAEQPARPWMAQAMESAETQVIEKMDSVLEEFIKAQED